MLKFLPLGVPSFTPFLAMKYFFVPLGRAVRYNLCCVSLHTGFPLPSLTQNQHVFYGYCYFFIAFAVAFFYCFCFFLLLLIYYHCYFFIAFAIDITIAVPVCISTLSPSPLERAGERTKKTFNIKLKVVVNF